MPFEDCFFKSYEILKEHFVHKFEFDHAGIIINQQNILTDIFFSIYSADIILADLTGLNPNVMYESTIENCFNKKTLSLPAMNLINYRLI